jgi:hypothetical protein
VGLTLSLLLKIKPGVGSTGGFFWYTIRPVRPVEKGLVCNRKGPICKDSTIEINSIQLVFFSCRTVVFKGRMGSIRVLSKI